MAQPITDPVRPVDANVLLVDDDPAILRVLSTWLEKAGYRVRRAGDGELALAAIEAECPDFLVTDWQMPNLSGLETLRIIRQEIDVELPAIVVSSHVSDSVMSEALTLHAFTVLSKMVSMHRILHAVARVLEKYYSL